MAVISKTQWKARLEAALWVQGKTRKQLLADLEEQERLSQPDGLGFSVSNVVKAMQDGSRNVVAGGRMAEAVAGVLGLPVEWFTVDDFGEWLAAPHGGGADQLDRIEDMLKRLLNQAQAAPAEGDDLAEAAGEALDQLGEDDDAVDPPPE